jgi:MerR family transcriptional regulator, thiopeptide resistance regulator
MTYTVKHLSALAGVSPRTLHYYDEIGLLKPASYGENGYRYYDETALLRLQQILFFKELEFPLEDIRDILNRPEFDMLHALQAHKTALQEKAARLKRLIDTVDTTILHLKGKTDMNDQQYFEGFSEEKQKQYAEEIRQRYGNRAFEGVTDWNSYTPQQKAAIKAESEAIYRDLAANMDKDPASPEVQQIIARWHQHLRYFYEPTIERLLGLPDLYIEHPDFQATFNRIRPGIPEYMKKAVTVYCQGLKK